MVIEFRPVSEVKETGLVGRIGQTIQKGLGQIFAAKTQDFGQGVTVESPRFGRDLVQRSREINRYLSTRLVFLDIFGKSFNPAPHGSVGKDLHLGILDRSALSHPAPDIEYHTAVGICRERESLICHPLSSS